MSTIMPAFNTYPSEAEIIGKLLAGYGDLEFELCQCVGQARNDFDMAFKAMFRIRSESQRIEIGDAMARNSYHGLKLGGRFSEAISDMHVCRKIRNQYAHCHWYDDWSGQLAFVLLEEISKERAPVNLTNLTIQHVTVDILYQQERFFCYVSHCLTYLNFEAQKRSARILNHPWKVPKRQPRPPFFA